MLISVPPMPSITKSASFERAVSSERCISKSRSFSIDAVSVSPRSLARAMSLEEFVSTSAEEVLAEWRPTYEENRHIMQILDKTIVALKKLGPAEIVKGGAFAKGTNIKYRDEVSLIVVFPDLTMPSSDDPLLGEWQYGEGSKYTIKRSCGKYCFCEKERSAPLVRQNDWWVAELSVGKIRLKQHDNKHKLVSNFMKDGTETWDAAIIAVSPVHSVLCRIKKSLDKLGTDFSFAGFSLKLKVDSVRLQILLGGAADNTEIEVDEVIPSTFDHDSAGAVSPVVSQISFIKHQDAKYKDLVRYCKVWRSLWQQWPTGSWIKSFLLELLALDAYQRNFKAPIATIFIAFLELLQQDNINIAFGRWYDGEQALAHFSFSEYKDDIHRVLDPANPTSNIAQAYKRETWAVVQCRASETLAGITAISGTAALLLQRLRSEVTSLKEAVLTYSKQLGPRIEFDVSGKRVSKVGESIKSPEFKALGIIGLSLLFYPKGTEAGAKMCSLIIKARVGTRLRYKLFVDDTEKPITDRLFDAADKGWGFSTFCAVKHSYSRVGVQIFQAAFTDPESSIGIVFEHSEHQLPITRVTWNLKGRELPAKGECIDSDKFTVDGIDGIHLSFYPNGDPNAEDNYCSLYLNAPDSFFKWKLFVDSFELGPLNAGPFLGCSQGYRKFCLKQDLYTKVGVLISEVRLCRSPTKDLNIFV